MPTADGFKTVKEQRKAKSLKSKADDWNEKYPVGTPVILTKDEGEKIETETRTPALILSEHTVVVWLKGISGCWDLDNVEAIK